MNKLFKTIVLVAAGIAALMSCNKEADVTTFEESTDGIVLNFTSERPGLVDADTKTVYNLETGSIDWSKGDKIKVGITVNDTWMAAEGAPEEGGSAKLYNSAELVEGGTTGVFSVPTNFKVAQEGTYKFYGLYPASAISSNDANYAPSVTFSIPNIQTPALSSFDNAADVMIAVSGEYDGIPSDRNIDLEWSRIVAHGDITLKKLPELASDETIQGLTISAQEGADLVGRHYVDLTTGIVTLPENTTALNEIVIDTKNLALNTTDNTLEFWFTSLPFTASSLKIVLTTNKKVYTKEYTGLSLSFLANRRNTLGIGMKNASVVEKSQLIADGEYVISYDPGQKMMAVGTVSDSFRESVALNTDTPSDSEIWTISYVAEQDAYKIYNADVAKYLFGYIGDETYLEFHEATYTSESYTNLFQITESTSTEGAYVITPQGNTVRKLGCNMTQPRFALYKGGTNQPVDLNLHSVSFDTTPRIEVVKASVNMAKSAITEARTINTIKRKYFDGAITATSSADWLVVSDLAAGETEIKATIAANSGEQRSTTVTLSADGIVDKTFTVIQAPGATEVTDVIDRPLTGVTGTGYSNWTGKTSKSSAVYAGNSAGGNDAIQLRTTNSSSGIITTASGGIVKSIVVTWNSNTSSDRKVNIYGKNSVYTNASDLYGPNAGELLGTISSSSTTLEITEDYEYIGIRSSSGALYIDKIEITWGDAKQEAPISWSADAATATLNASGIVFNAPILSNNQNLDISYISSNTAVATVESDGTVTPIGSGTAVISAVFTGNGTYKPKTVSYNLTVTDNRPTVAKPQFNPEAGTIEAGTVVLISCTTEGATIYYTVDGSDPTTQSTPGTSVTINATTTLKAIAVKAGYRDSAIASANYIISGAVPPAETITFSEKGYSNQQEIATVNGTNMSISFNKGSNSNAPKYYTSGEAIRAYGGNYFTVTSSHTMSKIELTFGSSDGSNAITTDVVTYSNGTWSGSSKSVTFTIGGSSGNRRIAAIKVTYSD